MRIALTLVCVLLTLTHARSEPLSAADREALLGNLEALRESANSKIDARFRMAISAYRAAMTSGDSVMEFYLKCVEKVNFEDQQKKPIEFREWKRKEADHLSDAGFRLALRYQLSWLVLTLKASSEKADPKASAAEAREIVDAVFLDAPRLESQGPTLRQGVTSTVFARAYDINGTGKEDWPTSPILLEQIYDKVLLPPLRTSATLDALRATWIKRIRQQAIEVETWSDSHKDSAKGKKNGQGPDSGSSKAMIAERFTTETLPELEWQMELDLFRSGDESGAAKRMLLHLQKYINHKSARKWSEEFKALLTPAAPPAPTAAVDPSNGG